MQRMVNQFGTAQDSPELKQQLYVQPFFLYFKRQLIHPSLCRYQIRTYTQQLIKDTDNLLKDLVNCKDRHLKIQRDRLVDEFTSALTAFQAVQRKTVDLEKNAIRHARAATNQNQISKPPGGSNNSSGNNSYNTTSLFEDNFVNSKGSSGGANQTQIQMQEQVDLQALEEQEQSIRELEVRFR
jgi:syntaxin 7